MKLRYFQTYDHNGVDSQIELQYWDKIREEWCDVPHVRVRYDEEDKYKYDENAVC